MPHSAANILIHCVFSTHERRDIIPPDLQPKLWRYFWGIGNNHNIPVLCAGGIANHAHLLFALPPTVTLSKAVQVFKANSSRWLGEHGIDFAWQEGYGAFSVSPSNASAVKAYINHQEQHHKRQKFEDEFVTMLRKAGMSPVATVE